MLLNVCNEKELKKTCEKMGYDYEAVIDFLHTKMGEQGEGSYYLDEKGITRIEPLNDNFMLEDNETEYWIEITKPGICRWDEENDCLDQSLESPEYKIEISKK